MSRIVWEIVRYGAGKLGCLKNAYWAVYEYSFLRIRSLFYMLPLAFALRIESRIPLCDLKILIIIFNRLLKNSAVNYFFLHSYVTYFSNIMIGNIRSVFRAILVYPGTYCFILTAKPKKKTHGTKNVICDYYCTSTYDIRYLIRKRNRAHTIVRTDVDYLRLF